MKCLKMYKLSIRAKCTSTINNKFFLANSVTDLFLFRASGMRILTKTGHSNTALV